MKIADAMNSLYLNRDEAIIALIGFHWDLEKFKELWYDNVEKNRIKCRIDFDPTIKLDIKNTDSKMCRICEFTVESELFALRCGHAFCIDCWKGYCESRAEDLNTMVITLCPQKGCNLLVYESILFKFLPNELIEYLKKSILRNFTDKNNDIKWCPAPGCGICVQSKVHSSKEIECECGMIFCFGCGKEAHRPCPCDMVDTWDKKK